jgi:tight adherence protein B
MVGLVLHSAPAMFAVVAAAVVIIATMLLFIGLGRLIEPHESVRDRIDALSAPPTATASLEPTPVAPSGGGPAGGRLSSITVEPLLKILNRILSQRSFSASIATELARANVALTVSEYVLITLASGLALFSLAFILLRQVLFAFAAALVGLLLPRVYVQRRQAQRLLAFQEQLPDILTMLVGSLRSGYGITIAMDMVAKQMPPPACDEFNRVVREIGLGASTTQALANLVRRVRSDDLDLVVTAIAIQYDVGGNLATILETISGTVRERVRLKGLLRALTAQQGLQRTILTLLPVVLAVIIYILNPTYIKALFSPGPWLLIPAFAAVLVVLGYVVMGKLSQVEF